MTEKLTKEIFNTEIKKAGSICILGHVSPDGDCIGSCLGVYNYIKRLRPCDAPEPVVYLEEINEKFGYLEGSGSVRSEKDDASYELAVVCDCAGEDRIGKFLGYLKNAGKALLIDHHITNEGFGDYAFIDGQSSSASEILYTLMDESFIDRSVAECIYTGIIHDTGVFRHSSTHESTMVIAGKCMAMGIDFGHIIEDSFFSMTFAQKRLLGYLLSNIESLHDGKLVYSYIDMAKRREFGAEKMDMDGMVDNIRTTSGALAALYMYETVDGRVKASLRSNSDLIDVSVIASAYGGGGHRRAAGCFMSRDFNKNIEEVSAMFAEQLKKSEGR